MAQSNGIAPAAAASPADGAVAFAPIEEAIAAIRNGEFVIAVDDDDRENEGDLIIAAEKVTEAQMAFLVRYTSGLICAPALPSVCDRLRLPLMVPENEYTEPLRTKYTVSIDARANTTTGISAHDRSLTANLIGSADSTPADFIRPGHMFPLRYEPGGVLVRRGHTEASVDLCLLAGLQPAAVIAELQLDTGKMMRRDDCFAFAQQHGIKLVTIDDLAAHIRAKCAADGSKWMFA
ncbi:3,4-dihydroxy-2-butanone 4-phosphate synthase [Blastocladiella britannica]|nr:3,4-dihydroxy-2-butanone 4-phosphate synthase [Blastocladiella britannica]